MIYKLNNYLTQIIGLVLLCLCWRYFFPLDIVQIIVISSILFVKIMFFNIYLDKIREKNKDAPYGKINMDNGNSKYIVKL